MISYLQTSEVPLYKQLFKNVDQFVSLDLDSVLDEHVVRKHSIFVGEKTSLIGMRTRSPHVCNLALGKDSFYVQNIGFPVRKSFPYKEDFNKL